MFSPQQHGPPKRRRQGAENVAYAVVAQLVEHHLAKVDVASSNLVNRSHDTISVLHGGVAERRGNGLQIRAHGFESRSHLHLAEPKDFAVEFSRMHLGDWRSGSALP